MRKTIREAFGVRRPCRRFLAAASVPHRKSGGMAAALHIAFCLLLTIPLFAAEVTYQDDFQSYKTPSNPPGWVDTSVGDPRPEASGLFKAWPDPLQGNQATNVVYGTKQSSGKPEGNHPRIGTFSTLTTKEFDASGRFEYRGRLLRTDADSRIGLTFLSSYPERDQYYLIGLWGPRLTMQLFAFGAGALQGNADSNLTIDPNRWYRFLIQVDDLGGATHIRARFWLDGTTEPSTFAIEASDNTPQRLTTGRIGMWAAVKGDAYIDDLFAKSPVDNEPPVLTITSPTDGAVITTPSVIVTGTSGDAVSVTVNNTPATIEGQTFRSAPLALTEGVNTIIARGSDAVGNVGTAQVRLELDTRAPELSITTPAADACLDATTLTVSGTVRDPRIAGVKVNGNAATITNGAWSASLPVDEGSQLLTIVAADTLGHLTTIARNVRIDRTAPAIDVRESGAPFTATLLNRSVSFAVRATDADPQVSVIAKLDGAAYTSGTLVTAEGAHRLEVTATDCAAHTASRTFAFTIDRTPPSIRDLDPANGATIGHKPNAIRGVIDADGTMIEIVAKNLAVAPAPNATFTIENVPFAEGVNRFALEATDQAGNRAQTDYVVTVKTSAPSVSILENGSPLLPGTLYSRAVTPIVKATDGATIAATLNGAAFTSGASVDAEGEYRLIANATDDVGHTGTAETTFTIDRTAPVVHITSPSAGSVSTDLIEVRGTATNAIAAEVNGIPVTLEANGAFVLPSLPIELGTTQIVATARDRAGNIGRDEIEVTRDDTRPGIILTYPYDRALTNRPATEVLGRVLSPSPDGVVTIGKSTIVTDALGAFRFSGYPLVEGDNTITASTKTNDGATSSASVVVTADFTPPALAILESAQPLSDGARFAAEAVLSLQTSEANVAAELTLDGVKIATLPHAVTTNGGHVAVAVARDLAGNETRVERTFFIGTSGGAATCALDGFDPIDNSVVLASSTTLVGRVSGASSVTVNGAPATVTDGSFRATVELPNEGANTITIRCSDSEVTLTLHRITGDPSISISSPAEGFVTVDETIAISGTVGGGVVSADVNSAPATITADAFHVPSVRLTNGLNVLVAHGRNAAGRVATASRRVFALHALPSISISSPLGGTTTGAAKIVVAGTYANLDPSTIVVAGVVAQTKPGSDTTGSFTAEVPLVTGEQTLRVSGRDRANREASATVIVKRIADAPAIEITTPADHTYFGPDAGNTFTVSGTIAAAEGSTVEVAGVAATLDGSTFTATAPFSVLGGGVTAVVARVVQPDGASAIDSVVVTKLGAAPKVIESFPAPNAVEVDAGALLLVLFSAPMDRATLASNAFRLEDASGAAVSGTLFLDKDVLTFAPSALLARGARYTLRVTTAAKDLAGTPIATEWIAPFTIGTSAPSTPPSITPVTGAFCGQTVAIDGTAPAGARLQLQSGELTLTTLADARGQFHFDFPLSGRSGFAVVRVRIAGSDGSLSPAAELAFRVDCAGPQVLHATYDRSGTNQLTIEFSEAVDPATTGAISIAGAASVTGNTVVLIPTEDLTAKSFTLAIGTALRDVAGNHLAATYTQDFPLTTAPPPAGDGSGFISGEVYDATTGRPLEGATITVEVPSPPAGERARVRGTSISPHEGAPLTLTLSPRGGERGVATLSFTTITDPRGRYLARLPEGAHTIRATHPDYTSVWRQIIVPAGAGVVPIDIRLTKRVTSAPVTFVGAQSIAGLLPLGWSPLASAEVASDIGSLTFDVPAADLVATSQNLTAVRYDDVRDEWIVLTAVVNIVDGKVAIPNASAGAYALVYPDKAPGLTAPPLAATGAPLAGVAAPAEAAPLVARSLTLDPPVVLPNGRTLATLTIEGAGSATFPSGTAVQAYIDEELRLADGTRLLDPPFATDLLLYRNLSGTLGIADFHLAPSPRAAQVILEIGFDHIRVVPYPGRLDRGTLIGFEGGRVPADDDVTIDIPAGATPEPLRASATSLTQQELDAIGPVAGFRVAGGFTLTLQRATPLPPVDLDGDGIPDAPTPAVELFKSARATFTVSDPATQFILAEVLDRMPRLAAQMTRVDAARVTTKAIDRSVMPVDGIIREGRYLILAAEAPIAFATGVLRFGDALLASARITANQLGVADLTRIDGIFNVPVLAKPAAPFTLRPKHDTTGEGAPYTHSVAPDPDAIVKLDLALTLQPPAISTVTVFAGQPPAQVALTSGTSTANVSLTTSIRASFSPAIDPSSVTADAIVVRDFVSGAIVDGTATAEGGVAILWNLKPGARLDPDHRYRVQLASTIRAASGAMLGIVPSYGFVTLKTITNAEVHPERISITIPDAQGVSRITGDPGAFPAGWQALVVRRGRDFVTRYQSTAASDGSFSFFAGNGGDASDRITLTDLIDLQVVNNAGNLAAILPLTPFVTEDRRGFIVSTTSATKFVSADGIAVDIPADTFDEPTMVEVKPSTKEALNDIPSFDQELNYASSVKLEFEGKAKQPIEIELPVPAGMDTANRDFILALRGQSTRGPRLMAVDTLRVENGKFTTTPDPTGASRRVAVQRKTGTHETIPSDELKEHLLRVKQSGEYVVIDIKKPADAGVGWAAVSGMQLNYELHWDSIGSLYASQEYIIERGGVIVIPVITGKPFTVVGVDAATGIEGFSKLYDPIPIGNPGISIIPPPQENRVGPFPVFGTPFRVETIELSVEDVSIETIPNFSIKLSNGQATVKPSGEAPLPSTMHVELLNTTNGEHDASDPNQTDPTLTVHASVGDLLVLLVEEKDADALGTVSVVFNEPILVEGENDNEIDAFLRQLFTLEKAMPVVDRAAPQFADVNMGVRYSIDSGNRRVIATLSAALQRDAIYRLKLSKDISDPGAEPGEDGQRRKQLKLGQGTKLENGQYVPTPAQNRDLHLLFRVRKPAGTIGTFELPAGAVRDIALHDNVLFVAAGSAGLVAYDVADPAALNAGDGGEQPDPFARAIVHGELLNVRTDHHGRIYVIGMGGIAGYLSSYRLEDFIAVRTQVPAPFCCPVKGSTLINWRLGYSSNLSIGTNILLSDRPESMPRNLEILVQDDEEPLRSLEEFRNDFDATVVNDDYPGGVVSLRVEFPFRPENLYLRQRITVVNETLDLRWSGDATLAGPAIIEGIIAGPDDRLRVIRNRTTYGVVSHLGFGIGVYDLNAIESNLAPNRPANYIPIAEQILLTRGRNEDRCFLPWRFETAPASGAIPEIWLSSDNAVRPDKESTDIFVYAPEPYRGLLDFRFKTPGSGPRDICSERSKNGLVLRGVKPEDDHPRITALKAAYQTAAGRPAYPHFASVATYRWHVDKSDNQNGVRQSTQGEEVTRDYVLLAGGDLGLLVVEVGGDLPIADGILSSHWPLEQQHLVDVIWIPSGAVAVRVVPNTNYAIVVSKYGRAHLVDLTRIDERWNTAGEPIAETALFPTALASIQGVAAYPDGVGSEDPRIVWTSEPDVAWGIVAPVMDADTGMLYAGHLMKKVMKVIVAIDPRIRLEVDLGEEDGLTPVSSIVPHGLAPPKAIQEKIKALPSCSTTPQPPQCRENASLGTFRLQVSLPGALVEALTDAGNELRFAVESERVFNAPTEQTPPGFPRSHLRRTLRDGTPEKENRVADHFRFRRVVPEDPELEKALRHQKGFNKFVSPWIVAIADPRASSKYLWEGGATPEQKAEAGCESCNRPFRLKNVPESEGVYELWTNGRLLAIRPEALADGTNLFDDTRYAYLGESNRLIGRFATIMADTVRTSEVRVAGQNPPVADGAIQETVYLHSGELESNVIDLDAGGRAGANVVIDRTYRSRTFGPSILGQGWESSNLRRLRALPNGDVEYRDATGEIWIYEVQSNGTYKEPPGLFLRLAHDQRGGWKLIDQQWRVSGFDDLGRLVYEADEFAGEVPTSVGNVLRYLYDHTGRLARIIDPVGRATELTYWNDSEGAEEGAYSGLLKEAKDWRERTVVFEYDEYARLATVKAPEFAAHTDVPQEFSFTGENRPRTQYTYSDVMLPPDGVHATREFNDYLELTANLEAIKEAEQAAIPGGVDRVTFVFGESGQSRDRLTEQHWASGDDVTFQHHTATDVRSIDARGQTREYTLTSIDEHDKRVHVAEAKLVAVPVVEARQPLDWSNPSLLVAPLDAAPELTDLTTKFAYNEQGLQTQIDFPNGLKIENRWKDPSEANAGKRLASSAPGMVLDFTQTSGPGLPEPIDIDVYYDTLNENRKATAAGQERDKEPPPEGGGEDREKREAPTPSRENLTVVTTDDDDFSVETEFNTAGQPTHVRKKEKALIKQETSTEYKKSDSAELIERSRLSKVQSSSSEIEQSYEYSEGEDGAEVIETTDVKRGTTTENHLDSYGRPTRVIVTDATDTILTDEAFGYDAAGQLVYHSRRQEGVGDVITHNTYDAMGRVTETSMDGAQVEDAPAIITKKTQYEISKITQEDPAAAGSTADGRTITTLDRLGRPTLIERAGGEESEKSYVYYDRAGAVSYMTDRVRSASITLFDARGRERVSAGSDGLTTATQYSAWGQPVAIVTKDTDGKLVANTRQWFTRAGRLRLTLEQLVDEGQSPNVRLTQHTWGKGDTEYSVRVSEGESMRASMPAGHIRLRQQFFDASGRLTKDLSGSATEPFENLSAATTFGATHYEYEGELPRLVKIREPRSGAESQMTTTYDGLGRPIEITVGNADNSAVIYDEAGNVLRAKSQGMEESTSTYDSRGLLQKTTHPGGEGTVHYAYDALGNVTSFEDETRARTTYEIDGIGRLKRVNYPDGTSEETRYELGTGLVNGIKDRTGSWITYRRGLGGRIEDILAGEDTISPLLVRYEYDKAGRLIGVRNGDAGIEYGDFDLLGHPHTTRTYRYNGESGLSVSPHVLDVHTQTHAWNVFDERTSWQMPTSGETPSAVNAAPWLHTIEEARDGGSNLIAQRHAGNDLLRATGRAAGKLSSRERAGNGGTLSTIYGYDDGLPALDPVSQLVPPGTGTQSLLMRYAISSYNGVRVGGTANVRNAANRISLAHDLGTGNRMSSWDYDDRGRLALSHMNVSGPAAARPPTVTDDYTAADFRQKRSIPAALTDQERQTLGALAADIEPASWIATPNTAHQIETRTSSRGSAPPVIQTYLFSAGRRVSDGTWISTFDLFGRLRTISNGVRRIVYTWDPNGRLVGREAYKADGADWVRENRPDILNADGLPADTTFVWDPIADRLVAIYAQGKSTLPDATPESGLLRQYVHGDQDYDDPVRVLVADPGGGVRTYLPLIDEAGTGSLQAVLDANTGAVVERVLYADSYGDAPRYLQGAVVDDVSFEAKKNSSGIESIKIRIHLTEAVTMATLADGVRLTAIDGNDSVDLEVPLTLHDPYTIQWELGPTLWQTLSQSDTLEIAVTNTLRTERWPDTRISAPPEWAQQLHVVDSTEEEPFLIEHSFDQLTQFLGTVTANQPASTTLYAVPDLYLGASRNSATKLFTGFKAAPFVEPATSLVYFRSRWYDPSTGMWLTPDPEGYVDSSNPYAAFAGDPVNLSDPTGEAIPAIALWAIGIAVSTAIDIQVDSYMEGDQFNYDGSLGSNLIINTVTGGLGSIKHLKRLSMFKRLGIEIGADVLATGATSMYAYDLSAEQAFGSAAIGGVLGGAAGEVLGRFGRKCRGGCLAEGTEVATSDGPRKIEEIRVGDRVAQTSTGSTETSDDTDVDPPNWRKLVLRLHPDDGFGDVVAIEMLRPREWIQENRAAAGHWIDLWIPEMGIAGRAEVVSIEACPAIQAVPGRVVLTTYSHKDELVDLKLHSVAEPVSATPWHLFYSEDHGGWRQAGALRPGENIRTRTGAARIDAIVSRPGRGRVFEIEVETSHAYFVGGSEVLTHNSTPCPVPGRISNFMELPSVGRSVEKSTDRGGTQHHLTGKIFRNGRLLRPVDYRSGGTFAPINKQHVRRLHTERKYLRDVGSMLRQEGIVLEMVGTLDPCGGICQPAIRDAIAASAGAEIRYTATNTGRFWRWTKLPSGSPETVLQEMFENGALKHSRRYRKVGKTWRFN